MNVVKNKVLNNKGFTLAEMVVSLLLLVFVLGAVNVFLGFGINIYHTQRDRAEVAENLRVGINRLSRELRQAAEFKSYSAVNGGRLSFVDTAGSTVNYHISTSSDYEGASQLVRAVGGYGNNPVARYVHGISVEPADAGAGTGLVTVTLTGAKGRSGAMAVSTTVRLRN